MKTKYKIVSSTKPEFINIEIPLEIKENGVGELLNILGREFEIVQSGKVIQAKTIGTIGLDTWVITLQEIEKIIEPLWGKMLNAEHLRIHKEVEIFFETKEIVVKGSDRLGKDNGVGYDALFKFLESEWKLVEPVFKVSFPLEMREHNNLLLKDEWDLIDDSLLFLKGGSFTRINKDGRTI